MIASPSPSIEASVSPSPSAETSSAPTDAAEVKTIISFEAVAPEGLSVPQGTLETGLDLPASLNAQFSDGAAGEIPVTWQCAAGYDPNAEAGAQFAFAAVLPQGYAFSEGVSLPEILVTLTPTPVNTMLMAQASDEGWTLSDGKLTVTGEVYSEYFSYWNDVQSIEVTGGFFALSDGMSFSGTITVLESGYFYNYGNVSGTIKPPAKRSKTGWWWMKPARPCPIRTPPWKNWRKPPARCARARWPSRPARCGTKPAQWCTTQTASRSMRRAACCFRANCWTPSPLAGIRTSASR